MGYALTVAFVLWACAAVLLACAAVAVRQTRRLHRARRQLAATRAAGPVYAITTAYTSNWDALGDVGDMTRERS